MLQLDALCQIVRHDLIEFALGYVRKLQVLNLNALACVFDVVYLLLHLVEVPGESLSVHRVCKLQFLQALCELFTLLCLRSLRFLVGAVLRDELEKGVGHALHLLFKALEFALCVDDLLKHPTIVKTFWRFSVLLEVGADMALVSADFI